MTGMALIIEDEPDQATLVAHLLHMKGYHSKISYTGQEGLMLARRSPPTLIVLDVMLPDIDGFDVCRRLRGDPATRTTPIVMVTALSGFPERRRGYRVGANSYLSKPYVPDEIYGAIESALLWKSNMDRGKIQGEIQIELPSETPLLAEVNEFLTGICRETPLTGEQIAQLRQSIMEMGQNAIEWGNRHNVEALVRITYRTYEDRVEIVIRDEGTGFNPSKLAHAARPDDPMAHMDVREKLGLREGGFGMMISRGMLDELRYNVKGNEVTLVKRFQPTEMSAES